LFVKEKSSIAKKKNMVGTNWFQLQRKKKHLMATIGGFNYE
jgi:hypothetical protein